VLHPGELLVDADARLWTRERRERVLLAIGDPVGAQHSPFAPPALRLPRVDLGAFTPRLRVGRAVLQRATWALDAVDFADGGPRGVERYARCVELLRDRGVPDRVFARVPGEGKPLHVDPASPVGETGEVRLTEMLPGPDDLWRVGGEPHCCEFRFAFARIPDRAGNGGGRERS
jgi:hypothetical protein